MTTVISVENVSKQYRLGQVGTGTFTDDVTRLWYRIRGKEDPFLKIGQENDRTKKSDGNGRSDLVWALKDINFEVKDGEVLGIIGRNGAGKSTLLKLLARVTTPSTGNIKVKGRIASLLEVGTGFHPDLTGKENIYLNGAILGMRKSEITNKLEEIIDFSGCERYIDTPVKRYSSGMYVRLAFAVAAHLDPEILIVDEVLAVGDADFQKKCLGKMKDVAGKGRTVLFVSHNMSAVRALCSSGVLLANGSVEQVGTIDDVADKYSYRFQEQSNSHTALISGSIGSGDVHMRSVTLYRNGEPSTDFQFGDNVSIEIEFAAEQYIQKPLIGYRVSSLRGENAINANNYFLPSIGFSDPVKNGILRCELGQVPLMAGRYSISLWCGRNPNDLHFVEDAVYFDVKEKDIWGLGQVPTKDLSALWWPTEFSFLEHRPCKRQARSSIDP